MKKVKKAKTVKGRIKQINYFFKHWRSFFKNEEKPDFKIARQRRLIKEDLLAERNELIIKLKTA